MDDRPALMLDPSLLLALETLDAVERSLAGADAPVYVPATFRNWLEDAPRPELLAFFAGDAAAWAAARPVAARLAPFSGEGLGGDEVAAVVAALGDLTDDPVLAAVLADEWAFLQTQSWLAARTRASFDRFVEAGGVAVQYGRAYLDRVRAETAEALPELLTEEGMFRAVKWVAATFAQLSIDFTSMGSQLVDILVAEPLRRKLFALFDP